VSVVLTCRGKALLLAPMRVLCVVIAGMAWLLLAGCAAKPRAGAVPDGPTGSSATPGVSTRNPGSGVIVAPESRRPGRVKLVSTSGRFVVLVFPIGHLPPLRERLNVYRHGLKVGEVSITGPQIDDTIAADIVQGDAQPDDEVRNN
jgi:hypothetical protein